MFKSQAQYTAAKEDGQYDFLGLTSPDETHDPAWLEEIEIAFRTRRDSGALSELLNEWAAPAALHVRVEHSGEWKDDPSPRKLRIFWPSGRVSLTLSRACSQREGITLYGSMSFLCPENPLYSIVQ